MFEPENCDRSLKKLLSGYTPLLSMGGADARMVRVYLAGPLGFTESLTTITRRCSGPPWNKLDMKYWIRGNTEQYVMAC